MAKKRTDEQRATFMSAPAYSATLPAFTVNLLVRDVEASLRFYREVLGVSVDYADPDFAALKAGGTEFMLHADHTYDSHPWYDALLATKHRGLGAELRLMGHDADEVERRAREAGAVVLRPATTKGHGIREVMVEDPDGYVWAVGSLVDATP
jgi:catechol 2,3-dioxygenase-like lactoylglutathione lyase family enzyme